MSTFSSNPSQIVFSLSGDLQTVWCTYAILPDYCFRCIYSIFWIIPKIRLERRKQKHELRSVCSLFIWMPDPLVPPFSLQAATLPPPTLTPALNVDSSSAVQSPDSKPLKMYIIIEILQFKQGNKWKRKIKVQRAPNSEKCNQDDYCLKFLPKRVIR